MQNILIGLVQLGFLGFAVAIMFLAYKLLRDLVTNQTQNEGTLRLKIIAVSTFLVLSAVVLVLGIYFSINDPNREIAITIDLSPDDRAQQHEIRLRDASEVVLYDGVKTLSVKNQERITVELTKLMERYSRMEDRLDRLELANDGLESQQQKLLQSTVEAPTSNVASDEQGI